MKLELDGIVIVALDVSSLHVQESEALSRAEGIVRMSAKRLVSTEQTAQRSAFGVLVSSFSTRDLDDAVVLLSGLPTLYPGGEQWLQRRLQDVLAGRAYCDIARTPVGTAIGVTIDTPKPGRWKLSTVYVAPAFRGLGIGRALMRSCSARWNAHDVRENIVTVRLGRDGELMRLLGPLGFLKIDEQLDRYGQGRTEVILRRRDPRLCDRNC